jgi:hypothetical protein
MAQMRRRDLVEASALATTYDTLGGVAGAAQ